MLEPRLMLAADIFVNMTTDENDGIDIGGVSLREAVQRAEQAEVSRILFTDDLHDCTIFLDAALGALEINDDLTIDGQEKNVSIRGDGISVTVGGATIKNLTVEIDRLVIESGSATRLGGSVVGDLINNGTLAVASDATHTPPVANADVLITTSGQPAVVDYLLANDTDADGDLLSITGYTDPAHASLSTNTEGKLVYVPTANFAGTDSFNYEISDVHPTITPMSNYKLADEMFKFAPFFSSTSHLI